MSKRILSWQPEFNKFLESYLLATSGVPYFYTKKESVIIFKMTERKIYEGKFWRFFIMPEKNYFSYNTFVSYICCQGIFFQEYIEIEFKTFSIMFERFFKWQK